MDDIVATFNPNTVSISEEQTMPELSEMDPTDMQTPMTSMTKDIDPFNFKLTQKEKELYLKEYTNLQYYYLVKIQPTSSKIKYENNNYDLFFIYFYI